MVRGMGGLEELHLSNNCLTDPQDIVFKVRLYCSCQEASDFVNRIYSCYRASGTQLKIETLYLYFIEQFLLTFLGIDSSISFSCNRALVFLFL